MLKGLFFSYPSVRPFLFLNPSFSPSTPPSLPQPLLLFLNPSFSSSTPPSLPQPLLLFLNPSFSPSTLPSLPQPLLLSFNPSFSSSTPPSLPQPLLLSLLLLFLNPSFSLPQPLLLSSSTFSAVIEHTNKVIYLEDDDVASVDSEGGKHALTTSHCISYLWQSQVEIEHYSIAYFDCTVRFLPGTATLTILMCAIS